jgi:hypothetical protein
MDYLAMPEFWLAIPDLEGFYEASSHGRIRSLPRATTRGKILKPTPRDKDGRLKVSISVNGETAYCDVGVLVARVFIGPRPAGEQVCHGPAGLADNSPGNLYYGTPKRNMQDRKRDGTHPAGEKNGRAKMTWAIADEVRQRYGTGESQRALAQEFDVTPGAIAHIIHNRNWVR